MLFKRLKYNLLIYFDEAHQSWSGELQLWSASPKVNQKGYLLYHLILKFAPNQWHLFKFRQDKVENNYMVFQQSLNNIVGIMINWWKLQIS